MRRPTRQPFRGRLIRLGERANIKTPSRCAGVVATACTQGKRTQHGKPQGVVGTTINRKPARDRPGALGWRRGSEYRRSWVMPVEGRDLSSRQTQYVVKDLGDWATYKLRQGFRNCRWRCTRSKRVKSCPRAECGKSARPVR